MDRRIFGGCSELIRFGGMMGVAQRRLCAIVRILIKGQVSNLEQRACTLGL
jgi:hypothetical protein